LYVLWLFCVGDNHAHRHCYKVVCLLLLLLQFSHYWWPSVFGIIPSLIIYIYLGSLAADVSSAISGGGGHAAPPAGGWPSISSSLKIVLGS
jgi:hypothetical protein